jgi:hypothetical protein
MKESAVMNVPRKAVESRLVPVIVCAGLGAVLTVLAGAVRFPAAIAPLANCAIAAIGGVAGGGLAVLGRAVGRRE